MLRGALAGTVWGRSGKNRLYSSATPTPALDHATRSTEGMGSGSKHKRAVWLTVAALLLPGMAFAYVGPGAGISMLGALWGLIIGVVMAVGVILFWPLRIMLRRMKANKAAAAEGSATEPQATAETEPGDDNRAA